MWWDIPSKDLESRTEYFLGIYIGEYLLKYIPTKSCGYILGNIVIEVDEDDNSKYKELSNYTDFSGYLDVDKHREFVEFSHSLDKKYLPDPLEIIVPYFEADNMEIIKKGISEVLWDCDYCPYSVDVEDIEIIKTSTRPKIVKVILKLSE